MVVGLVAWLPLPHRWVHLPGPAIPTGAQVEVNGYPRTPDPGEFYITTVYQRPATLWWGLRALIQSDWQLVGDEPSGPQSQARGPVDAEHRRLRQVIYDTCGLEPQLRVTVLDLTEDSPLEGRVQPGDQLLEIDGQPIRQVREVRERLRQRASGSRLRLTMADRGGRTYQVETVLRTIGGLKDGPGLGLLLSSQWDDRRLPTIRFAAGSYEGNSSDLMLALDACERLLALNWRRGRRIAGSGGLGVDGQLTPVQGLPQKLSSASAVGATVFFYPASAPAPASVPTPNGTRLVPVHSLAEAIQELQTTAP